MEKIALQPISSSTFLERFRASSVKITAVTPMVDDGTGKLKQVDSYQPASGALKIAQSFYNSRNRDILFQDGIFKLATLVPREEALDAEGKVLPNAKAAMWDVATGQPSHYYKYDTFTVEDTKVNSSSNIQITSVDPQATDITA